MGKSTISMAIFNSYVSLPEGNFFRQILSPNFCPKNDGIPWLSPIFQMFFQCSQLEKPPTPAETQQAKRFAGLPKPTGARLGGLCAAWEGASGQTQGSLWGLPGNRRRDAPAEGLGPLKVQSRLHQAGDAGDAGDGSSWCLKEWKNCLFFVGWMLGEHGNTW